MTSVGFVGLGKMGGPMVGHLLDHDHEVVAYDIDEDALAAAAEAGAEPAADVESLAAAVDVVMLSLPGPDTVRAVAEELRRGFTGGEVVIDHTTSKPGTTADLAAAFAEVDVSMLGAPVSGGRSGAEAGTLSVMVGGDAGLLDDHREILAAFADNVFHVSDRPEHAHALKLLNNYLSITALVATSEAVLAGQQIGLDIETMAAVFSESTGRNSATDDKFPNQVATGAFDTGFAMALVDKDIGLFTDFAEETGVHPLLGSVVRNLVGYAVTDRGGEADMTEIYKFIAELAGPTDE